MKQLNGAELAGFIKARQASQVRQIRHERGSTPQLAIIRCKDDKVINTYVSLKKRYGDDVGVKVCDFSLKQSEVSEKIRELNQDESIHGMILQLPLEKPAETDALVNLIDPEKDVDALGEKALFEPATPMAILWLLSGYNVALQGKYVLLVGRGKLVGAPLEKMLKSSGVDVVSVDDTVGDLSEYSMKADVVITATGCHGLITKDMLKQNAVVVDAGVASEAGKTVGDLDKNVYERSDLVLTPVKGGVGPLTVCALFDNLIRAVSNT